MNGILVVNKPPGMTSHDVVDLVRKRFKIKKVGHAGTLDPQASGLLVMLLGKFTKLSAKLINDDKAYEVIMRLGIRRDTQDGEGKIISEEDCRYLTDTQIKETFKSFLGSGFQVPPMFSAVKYKGKKLYELARKGQSVKREPRPINIYKLEITHIDLPYVNFNVTCSKGTYVRQLCSDIGDKLGCGAYMHFLQRLRSGKFSIESAVKVHDLEKMSAKSLSNHLNLYDSNTKY